MWTYSSRDFRMMKIFRFPRDGSRALNEDSCSGSGPKGRRHWAESRALQKVNTWEPRAVVEEGQGEGPRAGPGGRSGPGQNKAQRWRSGSEAIRGKERRLKSGSCPHRQRMREMIFRAHNPHGRGACDRSPAPRSSDAHLLEESGGMEGTGPPCGG